MVANNRLFKGNGQDKRNINDPPRSNWRVLLKGETEEVVIRSNTCAGQTIATQTLSRKYGRYGRERNFVASQEGVVVHSLWQTFP
jgi:hypothetical protein